MNPSFGYHLWKDIPNYIRVTPEYLTNGHYFLCSFEPSIGVAANSFNLFLINPLRKVKIVIRYSALAMGGERKGDFIVID